MKTLLSCTGLTLLLFTGCSHNATPLPQTDTLLRDCQKTSVSKMVLTQKSYKALQELSTDLNQTALYLDTINDFLKWFGGSLGEYSQSLEVGHSLLNVAKIAGLPLASDLAGYSSLVKKHILLTTQTSTLIQRFTTQSTLIRNELMTIQPHEVAKLELLSKKIDTSLLTDMVEIKNKTLVLLDFLHSTEMTLSKLEQASLGTDKLVSGAKEWLGIKNSQEISFISQFLKELRLKSQKISTQITLFHSRLENDIALSGRIQTYFELINEIEKRP